VAGYCSVIGNDGMVTCCKRMTVSGLRNVPGMDYVVEGARFRARSKRAW